MLVTVALPVTAVALPGTPARPATPNTTALFATRGPAMPCFSRVSTTLVGVTGTKVAPLARSSPALKLIVEFALDVEEPRRTQLIAVAGVTVRLPVTAIAFAGT